MLEVHRSGTSTYQQLTQQHRFSINDDQIINICCSAFLFLFIIILSMLFHTIDFMYTTYIYLSEYILARKSHFAPIIMAVVQFTQQHNLFT